jgi:hypothetical protein
VQGEQKYSDGDEELKAFPPPIYECVPKYFEGGYECESAHAVSFLCLPKA